MMVDQHPKSLNVDVSIWFLDGTMTVCWASTGPNLLASCENTGVILPREMWLDNKQAFGPNQRF